MFKSRFEEGRPLEECGGYVVTDRKILGMMNNGVRPFLPKYVLKKGVKVVGSLPKMMNDRFKIGHSPVERFLGQFCNKFRCLRSCSKKTDIEFVQL